MVLFLLILLRTIQLQVLRVRCLEGVIIIRTVRPVLFVRLPARVHVHVIPHLIPRNHGSRSMRAENRPGRIPAVRIRVIPFFLNDLPRIVAGFVPFPGHRKSPAASGIARDHCRIVSELRGRNPALQNGLFPMKLRGPAHPVHHADVRHCAADILRRKLQRHIQNRFQQNVLRHHQPLPHSRISGLPEVSAGGVLFARLPAEEADSHIRKPRSREHSPEPLYRELGENQILPVAVQRTRNAAVLERDPAPLLARLQQKMHLRVVPQRLEMSDAFHRPPDGLLIDNAPRTELRPEVILLPQEIFQNFNLDRTHNPHGDVAGLFFLRNLQHRLLFLQLTERLHQGKIIHRLPEAVRRRHRTRHDRRQDLLFPARFPSKPVSRTGIGEPGCRHDFSGAHAGFRFIPVAGVQPQLADLLFRLPFFEDFLFLRGSAVHRIPALLQGSPGHTRDRLPHTVPHGKRPACNLHPGKAGSVLAGDLIDKGAEIGLMLR